MRDSEYIGHSIALNRANCHLSRADLARLSGVALSSIECYEAGVGVPNVAEALALADVFGCTLDSLIGLPAAHTRRRAVYVGSMSGAGREPVPA